MNKTKIPGSVVAENSGGIYKTSVSAGDNLFITDEPKEAGGENAGPSPTDYLCMSLASCKAITIRMYARRKGLNLDKVIVKVSLEKDDQMALASFTFFCSVTLSGDLSEEQQKRILQIAKACPVDRLLSKPNKVVTVIGC